MTAREQLIKALRDWDNTTPEQNRRDMIAAADMLEADGVPVASIYITPGGDREFDDWKHDLPVGRNELYTAPHPTMAWQPIDTAPKDSTSILICCPNNKRKPVCEAWWTIAYEGDSGGHWQTPIGPNGRGYIILPTAPTHWMPLPPALGTQPTIESAHGITTANTGQQAAQSQPDENSNPNNE